jgi:hypothetical protein
VPARPSVEKRAHWLGLMATSPSTMLPLLGSKLTRVRPCNIGLQLNCAALTCETVMRLTPSLGSRASADEVVMTNSTFAASDHVLSARRAAATTSAGVDSMLAGGALSEVEREMLIVAVGHLTWSAAPGAVYWSV